MKTLAILLWAVSTADVDQLDWMSGCWEMVAGPLRIEEQWMKPAGGTMLGMSRTLKGGKTAFSEFMRIERRGQEFFYVARIDEKRQGTPFRLVRASGTEAVFENPTHDFPQRIVYRKAGDGLFARIEDMSGKKGEDFPMQRGSCAAR